MSNANMKILNQLKEKCHLSKNMFMKSALGLKKYSNKGVNNFINNLKKLWAIMLHEIINQVLH